MGAPFASDAPEGLVSSGAFVLCGARREEELRRCPSHRLSGTAFVGKGGRLRNRFGGRGIAADACGTYGTAAGTAYQRKSPRTRAGLRVSSSSTKSAMWSPQAGAGLRIVRNVLWSASFGGLPSHDALPIMHGESGERGFDKVEGLGREGGGLEGEGNPSREGFPSPSNLFPSPLDSQRLRGGRIAGYGLTVSNIF